MVVKIAVVVASFGLTLFSAASLAAQDAPDKCKFTDEFAAVDCGGLTENGYTLHVPTTIATFLDQPLKGSLTGNLEKFRTSAELYRTTLEAFRKRLDSDLAQSAIDKNDYISGQTLYKVGIQNYQYAISSYKADANFNLQMANLDQTKQGLYHCDFYNGGVDRIVCSSTSPSSGKIVLAALSGDQYVYDFSLLVGSHIRDYLRRNERSGAYSIQDRNIFGEEARQFEDSCVQLTNAAENERSQRPSLALELTRMHRLTDAIYDDLTSAVRVAQSHEFSIHGGL